MATLDRDTVFSGLSLSGLGQLSVRTLGATSSLVTGQLAIVHQASGLSLCFRSDDTVYVLSGVTIADPSLMSEAL